MMMNTGTRDLENAQGWAIALGMLLIVVGILGMGILPSIQAILAIASSSVAIRALTVALSWAFSLGAILRVIYAIQTRYGKGFWLKLIPGILYLAVGSLLLSNIGSVISLTLAVGIAIFIEGVFEVFLAFRLCRQHNWGWVLFSGMVKIIAGILIWSEWPIPGIVGLLPAISLLSTGIWSVTVSLADSRLASKA